ncbi:hypothetical protein ACI6Q2_20020 [Chitinophagaceae bacterium LWZ2-11]
MGLSEIVFVYSLYFTALKKEPSLKAQHYLTFAYLNAEEPLKAKEHLSLLLPTGLWKGKDSLETKNLFDALP